MSEFFISNVGVRQGENLVPVLFSLFLDDLVEFTIRWFDKICNATYNLLDTAVVSVYLKLYVLLYADDTVIIAESHIEIWKLEVNASKTKIAIFRKRRCKDIVNSVFAFNGEVINNEDDFTYLGIVFMSNGSFCKNKSKLVHQGRKALYSILKKSRKLNLPIDLQIDLFDTRVASVLLYGCEVWGSENDDNF